MAFRARRDLTLKMDLEACALLPDGRLIALGSGSTAARERIVVVTPDDGVRVVEGAATYAQLRARGDSSGSELNLEGAVVVDGVLRLFQRGNGAALRPRRRGRRWLRVHRRDGPA